MKTKYKILIFVCAIASIIAILVVSNNNYKNRKIHQISIKIDTQKGAELITENDIKSAISKGYDSIYTKRIREINLKFIENIILTNVYVADVNAYFGLDASLNINVTQHKPILRVFNNADETFYISAQGKMMPICYKAAPTLIVANGNIDEKLNSKIQLETIDTISYEKTLNISTLNKLFIIAKYISEDDLLNKIITQIYVNDNKHYELIPIIGTQNILLGDVDELKEKLQNLHNFYLAGDENVPYANYKTFDIRFLNQVICTKKDSSL